MKDLIDFTREEKSLILFFETQAVDYSGIVGTIHMNNTDMEIAEKWDKQGFIVFRRRPFKDIEKDSEFYQRDKRTHYVMLSDDAWIVAHALRKIRAENNAFTNKNQKIDINAK